MSENRWFDVGKVGAYCETITHSTEKRKDGEVKVLQLTLRVEPFDAKLATAVDPAIRNSLYRVSTVEQIAHVRKLYFALGTPRQHVDIFATPDTTKGTLRLEHVRIATPYARVSKDARGYALVFKIVFGPTSAKELEYAERWRNNMAFLTFTEAEHDELFDLMTDGDEDEDDAPDPQAPLALEGGPEFDTEADGRPIAGAEPARQKLHTGRAPRGTRKPTTEKGVH